MLPPGLLERLELVAELAPILPVAPSQRSAADAVATDLLDQLAGGPRAVRDLAGPDGRAGTLRRLRGLAQAGTVSLDWVLTGAGAGPRYERWVRVLPAGRTIAATLASGERPTGRALGPRQADALAELIAARDGRGAGSGPWWPSRNGGPGRACPARAGGGRGSRATQATARDAPGRSARWPPTVQRTDACPGGGGRTDPGGHRGTQRETTPARRRDRLGQDGDLRRGDRGVARGWSPGTRPGARRWPWPCRSSIGCAATSTSGSACCTRGWVTASARTSGEGSVPGTWTSWSVRGLRC